MSASHFRLRTFGGLSLEGTGPAATPALSQRKRLAFLALLAAGGERGVGRERLLLLLWPESTADRARSALYQLIYVVRQTFGEDSVVGTNELRLDPTIVPSDVAEFRAAIRRGDLDTAVDVYGGPFLDAFYLKDAPEFERWVEVQRQELLGQYQEALSRLAAAANEHREFARAVGYAELLVASDPLSARATVLLMEALAGAGDVSAALERARGHELLVQRELSVAADPSVGAFVDRLRNGHQSPAAVSTAAGLPPAPAIAGAAPPRGVASRRRLVIAVGTVAASIVAAGALWSVRARETSSASNRIVVAWFKNGTGDSTLDDIGAMTADWITDGLVNQMGARVVPSAAVRALSARELADSSSLALGRRAHASLLVSGSYRRVGDSLEFRAEMIDPKSGSLLSAIGPLRGIPTETVVFDSLLQQVAVVLSMTQPWGVHQVAYYAKPRSMAALREFMVAMNEQFLLSNWSDAIPGLIRARQLDPSWVEPLVALSSALWNAGRHLEADSVLALARAPDQSMPPGTRARVDWMAAAHAADWEAEYRAGQRLYALSSDNRYPLADGAWRTGRFHEAVKLAAIRDTSYFDREWASLDNVLMGALHALDQFVPELEVARRIPQRRGLQLGSARGLVRALAALGRSADVDSVLAQVWGMTPGAVAPVTLAKIVAGEYLAHGRAGLAAPLGQRALDWFRTLPTDSQSRWSYDLAGTLLLTGQPHAARAVLDSSFRAAPGDPARLGLLGIAQVLSGDTTAARDVDSQLIALSGTGKTVATLWRSRLAGVRGDCTAAIGLLRSALQTGSEYSDIAHHWWVSVGNARSCRGLRQVIASRD